MTLFLCIITQSLQTGSGSSGRISWLPPPWTRLWTHRRPPQSLSCVSPRCNRYRRGAPACWSPRRGWWAAGCEVGCQRGRCRGPACRLVFPSPGLPGHPGPGSSPRQSHRWLSRLTWANYGGRPWRVPCLWWRWTDLELHVTEVTMLLCNGPWGRR